MIHVEAIKAGESKLIEGAIECIRGVYPKRRHFHTEEWLRWKYLTYKGVRNSIFLCAIDRQTDRVVGTRGFMPFFFRDSSEQELLAFQSADTSVLEDYRGRGLFKELNQEALMIARDHGGSFVFNFPNDNSLPGYLKMGWHQDTALIRMVRLPLLSKSDMRRWNSYASMPKLLIDKSQEYLDWRFSNNPVWQYRFTTLEGKLTVIHRRGRIGRIRVEFLIDFVPSLSRLFELDFRTVSHFIHSLGKSRILATISSPVFTTVQKWKALGFRPMMIGRGASLVTKPLSDKHVSSLDLEITPGYLDTF